jgi:hypothetical protein
MAKKLSLMDHIIAANEFAGKSGCKSWFSKLPANAQRELEEIKKVWAAGGLHGVQIVVIWRGIVARCKEESWPAPKSETTINRWLRSSDK